MPVPYGIWKAPECVAQDFQFEICLYRSDLSFQPFFLITKLQYLDELHMNGYPTSPLVSLSLNFCCLLLEHCCNVLVTCYSVPRNCILGSWSNTLWTDSNGRMNHRVGILLILSPDLSYIWLRKKPKEAPTKYKSGTKAKPDCSAHFFPQNFTVEKQKERPISLYYVYTVIYYVFRSLQKKHQ